MTLARCFAFGAGFATAIFIIGEGINLALAASAWSLDDETTDRTIYTKHTVFSWNLEDDGFETVHPAVR